MKFDAFPRLVRSLAALATFGFPLSIGCAADTTTYSITNVGNFGGSLVNAFGLDDLGDVVGQATDASGRYHAFLYSGGQFSDLYPSDTTDSRSAFSISNSGKIVGTYVVPHTGKFMGFIYFNGSTSAVPGLGGSIVYPTSVNLNGAVVGYATLMSGVDHAFLYDSGAITDLGTLPGDTSSYAYAINGSGHIVGVSINSAGVRHAFYYNGKTMLAIAPLPGDSGTTAYAINSNNVVVGASGSHAFKWVNSKIAELMPVASTGTSIAYGVNDNGSAVGYSTDSSGQQVGAIWQYATGTVENLNSLLPEDSGFVVGTAAAINNIDQICGSGTVGGVTRGYLMTPQPAVLTKMIVQPNVVGGDTAMGELIFDGPTSAATKVDLSSSNANITVPSSATIAVNEGTATFDIASSPVTADISSTITAIYTYTDPTTGDPVTITKSAVLTVIPAGIQTVTFSSNPVTGGDSITGTAVLNGKTAVDYILKLTSSSTSATLPVTTVTVPAGHISLNFAIKTLAVTADTSAVITATNGSRSRDNTLTITP